MTSPNPRALKTTLRPPLAPLLALGSLAVLLAGCLAPAPALPAAAAWGDLVDVAPLRDAPAPAPDGRAEAEEAAEPCEPRTFLEDHQRTLNGGAGGRAFEVRGHCQLDYRLDVRSLAGKLSIQVAGPQGVVYERSMEGATGPGFQVLKDAREKDEGGAPPGAYRYTFKASGAADFGFVVEAV